MEENFKFTPENVEKSGFCLVLGLGFGQEMRVLRWLKTELNSLMEVGVSEIAERRARDLQVEASIEEKGLDRFGYAELNQAWICRSRRIRQ